MIRADEYLASQLSIYTTAKVGHFALLLLGRVTRAGAALWVLRHLAFVLTELSKLSAPDPDQ